MRVVFRVDASCRIGTGHVVRCMTLAAALREGGAEVSFISRAHEGHLLERLRSAGFKVSVLPAPIVAAPEGSEDYSAWLGVTQAVDAAQTVDRLDGPPPDWLVVDHYGLDIAWESALRPHVHCILVIDDLANRIHDCDALLDQNYAAGGAARYRDLAPENCRLLLGPEYALLRPEYRAFRMRPRPGGAKLERVFVFLGGTDHRGATRSVLEVLAEPSFRELVVHVVVGPNYADRASLDAVAARRGQTIVEGPRPHLAEAMWMADLGLGAGGTTTWERMCVGLPSLVVSVAENQRPACEALERDGLIMYLGSIDGFRLPGLRAALGALQREPERLEEYRASGRRVVDGLGASRIVAWLQAPQLRRPTAGPARVLFLGPDDSPLAAWLRERGERVDQTAAEVDARRIEEQGFDFLVSYGYRHILTQAVLDLFPDRAVNLHISYLPWNRGADPNLWSFVDGTPKGVTIHYLDVGVDTGDIVAQREVWFDASRETLATTYAKLHLTLQDLFEEHWDRIKLGTCERRKQVGPGSAHRARDREALSGILAQGWDTPVSTLVTARDAKQDAHRPLRGSRTNDD